MQVSTRSAVQRMHACSGRIRAMVLRSRTVGAQRPSTGRSMWQLAAELAVFSARQKPCRHVGIGKAGRRVAADTSQQLVADALNKQQTVGDLVLGLVASQAVQLLYLIIHHRAAHAHLNQHTLVMTPRNNTTNDAP
jgi:hypothetical protein